jgi:hypothetical protein
VLESEVGCCYSKYIELEVVLEMSYGQVLGQIYLIAGEAFVALNQT